MPRSLFGTNWVIGLVVISGFLIEGSVESLLRRGAGVARYAKARATRIAPLYYFGLISALAVEWLGSRAFGLDVRPAYWTPDAPQAFIGQMLMVQNELIGIGTFGAFAATSTVAFEVWYYCIWAVRIKLLRHRKLPLLLLLAAGLLVMHFPTWKLTSDFCLFWGYWLIGAYAFYYRSALMSSSTARLMAKYSYWLLALLFALCLLKEERPDPSPLRRRIGGLLGDAGNPTFIMHGPVGILAALGLNALEVNDFYVRYATLLGASVAIFLILFFLFWFLPLSDR